MVSVSIAKDANCYLCSSSSSEIVLYLTTAENSGTDKTIGPQN